MLPEKFINKFGYIILNGIRVANIIGLLAVVCASIITLVKTVIDSQFFFFDAITHVITAFSSLFLIVSELSLFRQYFERNWPLLSPAHGFVTLGLAMLVLGVDVLGNLNKQATSQQKLGLAAWRIMIASGILVLIFGFINISASFLFRKRALGVTARQIRSKGAVAISEQHHEATGVPKSYTFSTSSRRSVSSHSSSPGSHKSDFKTPIYDSSKTGARATVTPLSIPPRPQTPPPNDTPKAPSKLSTRFPISFGGARNNRRSLLPSYHKSPVPSSKYSDRSNEPIMEISAPMGINPQFAHLVRPDSVYHPSNNHASTAGYNGPPAHMPGAF